MTATNQAKAKRHYGLLKLQRNIGLNTLYIGSTDVRICMYHKTDPSLDFTLMFPVRTECESNLFFPPSLQELELESRTRETFNSLHRANGKPVIARMSPSSTGYQCSVKESLHAFIPQEISDGIYMRRLPDVVEHGKLYNNTFCVYACKLEPDVKEEVIRSALISSEATELHIELAALASKHAKRTYRAALDRPSGILDIIQNRDLMLDLIEQSKKLGVLTGEDLA